MLLLHYSAKFIFSFTENNMVELPPLRFMRETSRSDKIKMEAVVIDIDEQELEEAEMTRSTLEDVDETVADVEELSDGSWNSNDSDKLDVQIPNEMMDEMTYMEAIQMQEQMRNKGTVPNEDICIDPLKVIDEDQRISMSHVTSDLWNMIKGEVDNDRTVESTAIDKLEAEKVVSQQVVSNNEIKPEFDIGIPKDNISQEILNLSEARKEVNELQLAIDSAQRDIEKVPIQNEESYCDKGPLDTMNDDENNLPQRIRRSSYNEALKNLDPEILQELGLDIDGQDILQTDKFEEKKQWELDELDMRERRSRSSSYDDAIRSMDPDILKELDLDNNVSDNQQDIIALDMSSRVEEKALEMMKDIVPMAKARSRSRSRSRSRPPSLDTVEENYSAECQEALYYKSCLPDIKESPSCSSVPSHTQGVQESLSQASIQSMENHFKPASSCTEDLSGEAAIPKLKQDIKIEAHALTKESLVVPELPNSTLSSTPDNAGKMVEEPTDIKVEGMKEMQQLDEISATKEDQSRTLLKLPIKVNENDLQGVDSKNVSDSIDISSDMISKTTNTSKEFGLTEHDKDAPVESETSKSLVFTTQFQKHEDLFHIR